MRWRLLKVVLILPGNVLVTLPALILWLGAGAEAAWHVRPLDDPWLWLALACFLPGVMLAAWTSRLFVRQGEGTPAPWDPPRNLVMAGPYLYMRNPMISGVLLMLTAESLFFGSWALAGWAALFFLANAIYLPLVEERGLARRFGRTYLDYKEQVPRWLPRLTPWRTEKPLA